ncbi:MAG: ABC transporter ATP-binding protein [Actinomycetota bacterium]|nr:ABC transporter ATP-binding protein [Actinomycetota bacterium]
MTPLSTRSILSRLLHGHRSRVGLIAGTSMLGGLSEAVFLVVITRAAFAITDGDDSVGILASRRLSVNLTVVLALALVLFRVSMSVAANWHSAALNADVVRDLRHKLAHGFLRSTWAAQQSARSGHLQELVTTYSGSGAALLGSFSAGVVAAFSVASLLALATAVDPIGSLVAVGALGVLGFTLRPLRRKVQVHARKAANDGMGLALATNEISGLGMVVHVFDVRDQVEARVDALLDEGMRSGRRLGLVRGLVPAIYTGLAYLALVGAIGLASVWDTASLTSLGAVMLVMLRSLSYGQQLQTAYTGVASSVPAVRDVFEEIERFTDNEFVDDGDPVEVVCPLRLEHVSFHYTDGQPVLAGVSAEIHANELVGVVGPSGSGKSTLVQLLLGLRVPTEGRVLASGREIHSLRHADWARKVTFVPQSPALVHGTIAENVRFYRDGFSDADVQRALQLAGLLDEVTAFPDGLRHQVGDRGGNLSGGQQQRLCIARALVTQPELLILDEPTSALDARSEQLVRDTLNTLRQRMTVVVIAHRLSTLDECDRIMIIQDGTISAFDTPDRLRESSNFYAEAIRLSGIA